MKQTTPSIARVANGWQMLTDTMGVYGNSYLKRAVVAVIGLGANQVDDAIYPMNVADADGKPMDGNNDYVLHFSKAELPPVDAFWSITMYDAEGYQAANPLNRFAIGDRDAVEVQRGRLARHLPCRTPRRAPTRSRTGCRRPKGRSASRCGSTPRGPRWRTAAGCLRRSRR